MARRTSADALLLVDGYDLTGFSTSLSEKREGTIEDVTVFGDSADEQDFAGLRKFTLTQQGFFDDGLSGSHAALAGAIGATRVICYGVAGNAVGRQLTGFAGALEQNYERVVAVGKFHRANAQFAGAGAIEDGLIVHARGAETAAGDTKASAIDNGASSAAGGAAYLQVTALTLGGYTSWTVKLVHSSDAVTWADLATFSDVTVAPHAQRVAVVGTVNRYVACTFAPNGAGSGPSITFLAGFARG